MEHPSVLIASDSFKGSVSSIGVADLIEKGVRRVFPDCTVTKFAIADGGEGTVEAVVRALGGTLQEVEVSGPLGDPVKAHYGLVSGGLAVIEVAESSGITLIEQTRENAKNASSLGVGQMILDAIDHGATKIYIGLGGSATSDGGVGMAYGNSEGVTIPFDRLFYAGGSGGMRGWTPRTLGPGSVPKPSDTSYPTQLGDMKLEANLELRFPIWGIFHGATFFDLGNIWYVRQTDGSIPDAALFHFDSFYKQLGFNTGLGLRLDIKFVVLRLDWGIQLHNPNNPAGERWIHDFRWKNTALNFGVGYPF